MNEVMFHPEVQLKDEMWMATSAMVEDISMVNLTTRTPTGRRTITPVQKTTDLYQLFHCFGSAGVKASHLNSKSSHDS